MLTHGVKFDTRVYPILKTPIQELAKTAHSLSEALCGNLLYGNVRSPEADFARLEALGLCPCTLKLDLKKLKT